MFTFEKEEMYSDNEDRRDDLIGYRRSQYGGLTGGWINSRANFGKISRDV
jgi:hypothetical protein